MPAAGMSVSALFFVVAALYVRIIAQRSVQQRLNRLVRLSGGAAVELNSRRRQRLTGPKKRDEFRHIV